MSACTRLLGLEGTPDGVEDHGKLTRVAAVWSLYLYANHPWGEELSFGVERWRNRHTHKQRMDLKKIDSVPG